MGLPKKHMKKYLSHKKRWDKNTILEEAVLVKDYALKNKKEIRKVEYLLSKLKSQAKFFNRNEEMKNSSEAKNFIENLKKKGFLDIDAQTLDEVLDISIRNVLDRRLSNLLYVKKLAKSPNQARQFIVHRHVMINGKVINSPSYSVSRLEEDGISFVERSPLKDEEHPERKVARGELNVGSDLREVEQKSSFDENEAFRDDEEQDEVKE